jgi:hypothetical protein
MMPERDMTSQCLIPDGGNKEEAARTEYLVLLGFAEEIKAVLGPFDDEASAILVERIMQQVPIDMSDPNNKWGEGDTWVAQEQRRVIE